MNTPTLYIKKGCPYCKAAMEYLDDRDISYRKLDVRRDAELMQQLRDLSGQEKTPTLVWNGNVLADFGVDQLEEFLRTHTAES